MRFLRLRPIDNPLGFSLIEVMIAVAILSVVIFGTMSFMTTSMAVQKTVESRTGVNQQMMDLSTAMNLMNVCTANFGIIQPGNLPAPNQANAKNFPTSIQSLVDSSGNTLLAVYNPLTNSPTYSNGINKVVSMTLSSFVPVQQDTGMATLSVTFAPVTQGLGPDIYKPRSLLMRVNLTSVYNATPGADNIFKSCAAIGELDSVWEQDDTVVGAIDYNTGYVSIGVVGPPQRFSLKGQIYTEANAGVGGNALLNGAQNGTVGLYMNRDGSASPFGPNANGLQYTDNTVFPNLNRMSLVMGATEDLTVSAGGFVGIGTTTPMNQFDVYGSTGGTIASFRDATGSCSISPDGPSAGLSCSSDIRLKRDVKTIDKALEKILSLRGVSYLWKNTAEDAKQRNLGFIAQEAEKVVPELVKNDERGFKQINYANFVAVITESIKEFHSKWNSDSTALHAEIDQLKKQNEQIMKQLAFQNQQLAELKSKEPHSKSTEVAADILPSK